MKFENIFLFLDAQIALVRQAEVKQRDVKRHSGWRSDGAGRHDPKAGPVNLQEQRTAEEHWKRHLGKISEQKSEHYGWSAERMNWNIVFITKLFIFKFFEML